MTSRVLLFILTLFFAKLSFGQETAKEDIVKFKIKSVATIDEDGKVKFIEFYNDHGDIIKKGVLNQEKHLQIDREYLYNDSSQILEERAYTSSGDINSIYKFYYNDKTQLIKKEMIDLGNIYAIWTFEYDDKGNKVSETQKSGTMGNTFTKYKYDLNNVLLQEDKSNSIDGKEERINYKYFYKNKVSEKKTKTYYFNTVITLTYLYNDSGKLKKLVEKSSNGVSSTTIYEYNEKGLLVSDTWESSISKTPHKTTYQISFD